MMGNNLKILFWLPMLALVVFGCRSCETIDSSKLDPSEIHQTYNVTSSPDGTSVDATFRVSGPTGTTIALVPPSKVEYNGQPMTENLRTMISGTYYSAGSSTFVGTHNFILTDSRGRRFSSSADFAPVEITNGSFDIKRNEPFEVTLSRPLGKNESAVLKLVSEIESMPTGNTSKGNANRPSEMTPDHAKDIHTSLASDGKTLVVEKDTLGNFVPGKAKLAVEISASSQVPENGTKGGVLSYTIVSRQIGVNVLK